MSGARNKFNRRKTRVRRKLRSNNNGRPRLSVFRSDANIYAQVIDDTVGKTVAAASTLEKGLEGTKGGTVDGAQAVGKLVAERAVAAGITDVVFDRGGYMFHGRVKALADAAREGGLKF